MSAGSSDVPGLSHSGPSTTESKSSLITLIVPAGGDKLMSSRGPWASAPEQLVGDRLAELMNANAEAMAAIRPPIPNIGLVAPRFGYRVRPLTISDVASVNERYPGPKSDPLSA